MSLIILRRDNDVLGALSGAMASSRYSKSLVPVTHAGDGDGMALIPVWSIVYRTEESLRQGSNGWAVF